MYHIRLIKGRSYTGAVNASRSRPDIFTEDKEKYASAMRSGYFMDLTIRKEPEEQDIIDHTRKDEEVAAPEKSDAQNALSGMNVDELKALADKKGIDLTGAKKKADILDALQKAEEKAKAARDVLREQ